MEARGLGGGWGVVLVEIQIVLSPRPPGDSVGHGAGETWEVSKLPQVGPCGRLCTQAEQPAQHGPPCLSGGTPCSKVLQACVNRNCWNSRGPNTLCTKDSQLPKAVSGKESACQCRRFRSDPWVGKILWRRAWQPILVFRPGESSGQRSPAGHSPWGCGESDTTERPRHQCQFNSSLRKGQPDGKDEDVSPSALREHPLWGLRETKFQSNRRMDLLVLLEPCQVPAISTSSK